MLVSLQSTDGLPEFGLPEALVLSDEENPADIRISLGVGTLSGEEPGGPVRLTRGGMEARGSQEHLVWTHPEMGPIIDVRPRSGVIDIRLPSWAWTKTTNVFDQLLIPGLLPAFAARGLRAFHASAVEVNGYGVFFTGPSGSGKTTAALLLISNGAKLIADDMMFLYREEGRPVISGLGDGIRARKEVWERFEHFRPQSPEASGKKRLDQSEIPWKKKAYPRAGIILGMEGDPGRLKIAQALPKLLSLCYHVGDEEIVLKGLAELSGEVLLFGAEKPERAATIAMQPGE